MWNKSRLNMKTKKLYKLILVSLAFSFFNYSTANAEYSNLKEAIISTTSSRGYTLPSNENINEQLGTMGGANATLTIDGSSNKYGINAGNIAGVTVGTGNSLILQNLGDVTINGEGKSVSDYIVNSSVNGFNSTSYGGFINNNGTLTVTNSVFSSNQAYTGGAAINNMGTGANITEITNTTFIGNTTPNTGAAVNNISGASIGNINANFVNNSGEGPQIFGMGIYNYNASIGNVDGKFTGNVINASYWALGSAIYNANSSIQDISSDFTGNNAASYYLYGGTIYNENASTGNITGNFENNTATCIGTHLMGTVISNTSGSVINDITGDFKNNTAVGTYSITGGLIANQNSAIGNISGNFENNSLTGNTVYGYIYNQTSQIGNITGNFKNNTLSGTTVYGGIMNSNSSAVINKIEGVTFENNTAQGTSVAIGAAITNLGVITNGIINSKFLDNKAIAPSVDGAAIYTSKNLDIIADGSVGDGVSTFKGNYVQFGDTKLYEAIFISNAARTLTFNAKNGGTINLFDFINGVSGYTTNITGDSDSTVNLYNDILSSNVITENINLNLANDDCHEYQFLSLTSDANTKWTLDINADTKESDIISSTNASNGVVTIDGFNILAGDFSTITDTTYKIQILKTPDNSLQLALSDTAVAQLGGEREISHNIIATTVDTVVADNSWDKIYYTHDEIKADIGNFGLAKTDTDNDSIGLNYIRTDYYTEDYPIENTLALVNKADIGDRNFSTASATSVYNATTDLGETAAGTFTINGASSGSAKSTINLGDNNGFELTNVSALNVNNAELNGNNSIISVVNNLAEVNLNNATINGKVSNNGVINNNNESTITGVIENNPTGTINSTLAGLTGDDITNYGNIHYTTGGETITDIKGNGTIHLDSDGTTVLNNNFYGNILSHNAGNLIFGTNTDISQGGLIANGGSITGVLDNNIQSYNLGNVTLNQNLKITGVDFRLSDFSTDKFIASYSGSEKVLIDNINVIGNTTTRDSVNVDLSELTGIDNSYLAVRNQQLKDIMTPIRNLSGSVSDNILSYGPSGNSYKDFNPAVMASPVAAQIGGYLIQLNSYDEAFRNMDIYMMMTKKERQALKFRNKVASLENEKIVYDSTLRAEERASVWFRPYATFEKVGLHNGPKVENTAYGSFFGGESSMKDLGHGWDGMWGAYVGYNGSHQNYDGVSVYQNGGTLGILGMAYKDNFFVGGTINTGANAGEANTIYGNDSFTMLMAGIAAKTGYNWELADGKFIIQPSLVAAYSFVNTFDYTNAAGVRIDSDPLHAITIEPRVRFIGNLKHGWQPFAGVSVVINIMDRTHFYANDVSLPSLGVNPYVRYGIGIRKTWGERLTGFFQTFLMNGGRNGVGLQAGLRWAIGKNSTNNISGKTPELKPTRITLNALK